MRDYAQELAKLAREDLLRVEKVRRECGSPGGALIELDGRILVDFSSNSYLGLHQEYFSDPIGVPMGATASRLITGTWDAHRNLEAELAEFYGCDAVILFNSGYNANIGVLSSLAIEGDVIYSDQLNHASIIDGCRLSRAQVRVFEHNKSNDLRRMLQNDRAKYSQAFIVCESIYSMDGDCAPLPRFEDLAREFDCNLVVDEAHAVGVRGGGRGMCAELGVYADVLLGTLGKAFGVFGAYVCGSHDLIEYMRNTARTYIFTTALPPTVAVAALNSILYVQSGDGQKRIKELSANASMMRDLLGMTEHDTQIISIPMQSSSAALDCAADLAHQGFLVHPIRPPTVPVGTPRLRLSVSASHTIDSIEKCTAALRTFL